MVRQFWFRLGFQGGVRPLTPHVGDDAHDSMVRSLIVKCVTCVISYVSGVGGPF